MRETLHDDRDISELFIALELAWGIIANVSNGDWTQQSEAWRAAAADWRDSHYLASPEATTVRGAAGRAMNEIAWRREYEGTFPPVTPPHGDALLNHLREHDGPTHNED